MPVSSMKDLLEAGVHFGHHTRKWNPKMKRYIYGARNDIYIIDLHKTRKKLEEAYENVRQMAFQGKKFLFVGTKKQAQDAIKESALACEMYYVNHRWLGGMLTNWNTVQIRIDRLNQLDKMIEDGTMSKLVKKEQLRLNEERIKLDNTLGGIRTMAGLPDVIFVIDCKKEHIALKEARILEIPIVAVVDTNCDPDEVDIVIPGNDDAIRAVTLMASQMAEAINEGRGMLQSVLEERSAHIAGAGAVSYGSGQIDFAGAEEVKFAPIASDDDEQLFDQVMAQPLGEMPTDAPNAEITPAGQTSVASSDLATAQDLESNSVVTTTDQSFATGGEVGGDKAVDARADTFDANSQTTGGNTGGALDKEVSKAVSDI